MQATFNWNEFRLSSRKSSSGLCQADARLASILAAAEVPNTSVDDNGKPLPESIIVTQHPDVANFRRVLAIRSELANSSGQAEYATYARRLADFLDTLASDEPLFVVIIATAGGTYEFLYVPTSRRIVASDVSKL